MIKFYRTIRKNLLSEKKLNKYFFYAFGEIILVVIGILIALQINNWNISNQNRKEEKRILLSLKNDISNDILQLNKNINISKMRISKMDSVYMVLNNPKLVNSKDFLHFTYSLASSNEFNTNSGTFDESLSSGSLKFIQNDSLRSYIFEYYRNAKLNTVDKYATEQKYDVVFPVMYKNLSTTREFFEDFLGKPSQLNAINIESLSQNTEFVAAINQRYASEVNQIQNWNYVIQDSKTLLDNITKELNYDN